MVTRMPEYPDTSKITEAERQKLRDAITQMIRLDDEAGLFDADPEELLRLARKPKGKHEG